MRSDELKSGSLEELVAALERTRSERRVTEAALRESERRLNAVLDNASVAIFMMDEHQHCVYMNAAAERLTGYSFEETAGRPLHDVVHHTRPDGSHYPLEECPIDRAFPQNNREQGEEIFVHKDGSFYPVAFTASPIRDTEARIVGTIIEVRDIREERRMREALRETDRRKDLFLATLSHELRNPLAPIRSAVKLLQRTESPVEVRMKAVEIIDRQSAHLAGLLDDLLDLVRISSGRIELKRRDTVLQAALQPALEAAQPLIESRSQTIAIDIPDEPLALHADPLRLSQVICNLLTNAAKYSEPGTTIHVHAVAEDDLVSFSVADEGVGIPPDRLETIFGVFAHGTAPHAASAGLGIGLSIVRGLVELHGGTVEAKSPGTGRGSTFTVRLPRGRPATMEAAPETRSAEPAAPRPARILVADDNEDAALTLALLLRSLGHEVHTAHDGLSAVELAGEVRPRVVLLDLGMPRMSGLEAARAMRSTPWGRDLALVALTGWGQEADKMRTREAGFDRHLTKPVDFDELQRLLATLLASA